ncbi:hypothetical protein BKA70DRAFT_243831 [Coprinopsis sp. MPI-PUGE-AT-0042]|nr:hypothetical protein BKA70DRAFT_243831 [Coprinopsis sp. MPI-PUGE-AT-0042]
MELSGAENQSIMPNDPASIVGGIQGAGDVQLTNASINVVGRDSHSHTHVHYHGTTKDLRTILDAIYSFRNIQQDTLAKATPGTVKWLFVSEFFSVWWNQDGNITILWGSGIPGAGKTVLAYAD